MKAAAILFAALLCVLYIAVCGISIQEIAGAVLFIILLKLSYIDYKTYIIPDKLLVILAAAGVLYQFSQKDSVFLVDIFWAFLFISVVFLPIYFFTDSMGGGDVKLSYCLALWLSYPTIITAIMLAVLTASAGGIYLVIRNKTAVNTAIPFGPFLSVGGFVAFLMQRDIIIFLNEWGIL